MTTFNFRIRAIDDQGAFSDRDFSINVRNTLVERFAAVTTSGDIITSKDGLNWDTTLNALQTVNNVRPPRIVHGNGIWLVTNGKGNGESVDHTNRVSYDGKNWADGLAWNPEDPQIEILYARQSAYNKIMKTIFADGKFITLVNSNPGVNNYTPILAATSQDALHWNIDSRSLGSINNTSLGYTRIAYGNGILMMNSFSSSTIGASIAQTVDLLDPEKTPVSVGSGQRAATGAMSNIYFFNGMWIAVQDSAYYYTSFDGINWTARASFVDSPNLFCPYLMMYGNGRIVCYPAYYGGGTVSSGIWDKVYVSSNGIDWDKVTLPGTPAVSSITSNYSNFVHSSNNTTAVVPSGTFHNGLFVFGVNYASGSGTGGLYVSDNGYDWQYLEVMNSANTNTVRIHDIASIKQA